MIISFGWTTPALLACRVHGGSLLDCHCPPAYGVKGVTRRNWKPKHLARVQELAADEEPLAAWNTVPRNTRGNPHLVGTIQVIQAELSNEYPDGDWHEEGFDWMQKNGLTLPMPGSTSPKRYTPEQVWESWLRRRPWFTRVEFVLDTYLKVSAIDTTVDIVPEPSDVAQLRRQATRGATR